MNFADLYFIFACIVAALSGTFLSIAYLSYLEEKKRQEAVSARNKIAGARQAELDTEASGIAALIIRAGKRQRPGFRKEDIPSWVAFLRSKTLYSYDALSIKAGLADTISQDSYVMLRAKLSMLAFIVGALIGCAFSFELAVGFALVGLALGWASVPWAYKQEIRARNQGLEKQLSEMIEVVSLGLRSGLSFDRSLEMYHDHFSTNLSAATAFAQKRWTAGLATRETALRELADSYDSALFTRVIGNIIRSLRFGSTLAGSLEASAVESRSIYKASVEEKVAKAPVKMLIPTGTLILPAMLILVLGPVLLDLMQTL